MPDAGLRLHCWNDECVIWHGAAGDTHRMPQAIGQLLDRLSMSPANAAELSLAIDLHQEDVEQALSELARLGIVESSL